MKSYYSLLLIFFLTGFVANAQIRSLSGKKTTDSIKVKNAADINRGTKPQTNTSVVQPVASGVIIPNALIPKPVMSTFAPQPLIPTPEMINALQWWQRINPADMSIYTSPFKLVAHTQYDTTIDKFIAKQSLSLRGWVKPEGTLSSLTPDSMVHLLALKNLIQIDLPFIDDILANYLGQMQNLKAVYYHSGVGNCEHTQNTQFSDNGLERLLQNRSLEYVGFQANSRITNKGFEHFRGMHNLKVLYTHCWTGITDEALFSLEECSSLESLYFIESNISDQGLNNLLTLKDKLPNLTKIYVHGSLTTQDGRTAFIANWGRPIDVYFR